MSTNTILIIAILIFAPVFGVLLYNTYQEKKYRDSIRAQFGHADKDALMESHTQSVRDGQQQAPAAEAAPRLQPAFVKFSRSSEPAGEPPVAETPAAADSAPAEPILQAEPAADAPAFTSSPFRLPPLRKPKRPPSASCCLICRIWPNNSCPGSTAASTTFATFP